MKISAPLMLCMAFFVTLCQFSQAQGPNKQPVKVKPKEPEKPQLDYEYQFLNEDSTEGIEKSFQNGKLYTEIYFKQKGKFQFVKRYDPETGALSQSDTMVNFKKLVGSTVLYYTDGSVKEISHRDTAGKVDLYRSFYEDGHPKLVVNYKNGKRQGISTEYSATGTIKETGNYVMGKKEGEFKMYDLRGTLISVKKYHLGNAVGGEKGSTGAAVVVTAKKPGAAKPATTPK